MVVGLVRGIEQRHQPVPRWHDRTLLLTSARSVNRSEGQPGNETLDILRRLGWGRLQTETPPAIATQNG